MQTGGHVGAFRVIVRTLKPDQMMIAELRPEAAAPLPERTTRLGEIYGGISQEIDKQREEQDIRTVSNILCLKQKARPLKDQE
jgi:hypothetical protein